MLNKTTNHVVSTQHLSLEEVTQCLKVSLFTFWKKVQGKYPISKQQTLTGMSIVNGEVLFSFSNECVNGSKVFKLLQAMAHERDEQNALKRICGFLNKKTKENKNTEAGQAGHAEVRLRKMLFELLSNQTIKQFPWKWKINDEADQIIDRNGQTVFYLPESEGFSYKDLQNILEVKSKENPVDVGHEKQTTPSGNGFY